MSNKTIANRRAFCSMALAVVLLLPASGAVFAQTTSFTYQGKLTDGGTAANGNYDLQFTLWDAAAGGTQQPAGAPVTVTRSSVAVSSGIFTVQLDFGATAFPGADRFLEISARPSGAGSFTTLAPRQPITSTPYAIRSLNASSADAVTVNGVPSGSGNYVQSNPPSQQSGANFNISGNGSAGGTLSGNIVNATTQYNIGGSRVLSVVGTNNTFAGIGAGFNNTTGLENAFFGSGAGSSNTIGYNNSFFGYHAGFPNSISNNNTFFGRGAGGQNVGSQNSFFGLDAGGSNTVGRDNTIIGSGADVGANVTNATAIGSSARVDQSNSLVLGGIAGVNSALASVNVGIGTTKPAQRLEVNGITSLGAAGSVYGYLVDNGSLPGPYPTLGFNAYGPSYLAGVAGYGGILQFQDGDGSLTYYTSSNVSAGAVHANTARLTINAAGNVGIGQISPLAKLDIAGTLKVDALAVGGDQNLCRNSVFNTIATCSSSLRYKQQIAPYSAGLELINRLHPISFAWKASGTRDLGLGAEDVAKVEPLLVTHNDKGEIEGVKYDRLNIILINAVKEQQQQIERQQKQVIALQTANLVLNARLTAIERKTLRKRFHSRRR